MLFVLRRGFTLSILKPLKPPTRNKFAIKDFNGVFKLFFSLRFSFISNDSLCNFPHELQISFMTQSVNFCSFNSSYYASTLFPAVNPQPRAVKRQRLMTSSQARSTGIIASPQNQVVIQSPQQQQLIAANKLTSAANSLLQLQQQQQQMILASATPVVNLCNSMVSQNFVNNNSFKMCNGDNNETVNQQTSATGPFKLYSELNI